MNLSILIDYISRELHTVIRTFSEGGEELSSYCAIPEFTDPCYKVLPVADYMMRLKKEKHPLLLSIGDICYALAECNQVVYLIGPVLFDAPVSLYLCEENGLTEEIAPIEWLQSLSRTNFEHFIKEILFFHNLFADETCDKHSLLRDNLAQRPINQAIQKNYTKILFENQENAIRHNPYDQELREQGSIERGDLDALSKSIEEDYVGDLGTLSKDPVRNMKNLAIVLVTLASRSAIRGGLSPEVSFSLSDSYIQQIEEIDDISNLLYFAHEMEYHYASLVHDIHSCQSGRKKDKKNPHIEKCKDYVFSHLHDRITVDTLAAELGYHPDYLSHLFKESEGIGLSQYIIREKITRARNLLTYSDYSYSEIASYLGFASQSHFGTHFRKITGYTPRQYRETFGRD